MKDFILSLLGLLIPIIALMIPLVAVTAHYIIGPLTQVLAKRLAAQPPAGALPADERIPQLERQVAELQRSLNRVLEEQEFDRRLRIGPPQG